MKTSDVLRHLRPMLPLLALAAFWLLLLPPLMQRGQMTCSHDGALHLLRAAQLEAMVQRGVLWPRWMPGMAYGFGYPLFNFNPALTLYPVLLLHRLGLSLLQSWSFSFALGFLASGLTMYLWAREVLGTRGGFVAALAYMLAPYQLYDAYWRGNITESLTLPLLPLVMWAAQKIARAQTVRPRRWRYVLIGAMTLAALLLMHAPASLMLGLVLAAYVLLWLCQSPGRRTVLLQFAGMAALAVGLAAFFLIPALAEQDQVQLWRAVSAGGQYFRNHFSSLGELLGPAPASDPFLINVTPSHSLGWLTALLASLGVLATAWRRRQLDLVHVRHVLWACGVLAGVVFLMLPVSGPLWSNVPLLPFVQFPWRWLGVGSLLVAFLAGAGVAALDRVGQTSRLSSRQVSGLSYVGMGVCAVMLAAGVAPWAYPRLCPASDEPTQSAYTKYERSTGLIGTTSSAEYLPVAVQELPTNSPMVRALRTDQPVNRWDVGEARVISSRDDGLSAELTLERDMPGRVTYQAFYFPGWQATLDDQPVSISVVTPLGLMAIDVPAGRHTLAIRFGSTPLRTASEMISLLAVVVCIALWVREAANVKREATSVLRPPSSIVWLGLIALGLLVFGLKVGIVDRYDTPLRWQRWQDGQFKGATHTAEAVVAGAARLLGYDVNPVHVASGDVLRVDLYWTLEQPLNFATAVRLLDERGFEWSDKAELDAARGSFNVPPPSAEWPIGAYADDRHAIRVLPGTPPGEYVLVALPFAPDTQAPLSVSVGQTAPGGYPGLIVGRVQVVAPARPPVPESLDLAERVNAPLGDDVMLLGYTQDRTEAAPGQSVLLTLGWQARRSTKSDYMVEIELVAPDGSPVTTLTLPPGGGADSGDSYPTSRWGAGQVVRSQVVARVPGRAASGVYVWRVTVLDGGGVAVGQAALGQIAVTAPQRVWTAPAAARLVNARLGNAVMLYGVDAPQQAAAGQPVSVMLVWQSLAETEQDYKTFVHLLGAGGQLVAQSDQVPAGWARSTSGWLAGEFVSDPHTLELGADLPPGEYRLVAGMYSGDGRRLAFTSGGDVVELGRLQVLAR